ncbi:alpha/beta hydrolase [Frondihabitans cladoniiphilus]|uniref:Alpha/beta hydrolase n=1 Tax=Frondihabitans cladoniiphilus TaxID=715785 RepID=A0ABP8WDP9_9MICO
MTLFPNPPASERRAPRIPRSLLVVLALVLALVVGIAAAVAGTATAHLATGTISSSTASSLEKKYTAPVEWTHCGGSYWCGSIQAPLDWSDSSTSSIHLALMEHRPSGTAQGDLLVNPGGPGESGVDLVGSDVSNAVDSAVSSKDNVIGFDPRGVGYSSAVKCLDAKGTDQYLYGILPGAIGSSEWLAADRANAKTFASACEKNSKGLLAHVDTASAARDMDLIRADLGDPKLDYLGYSYGTYLGTIYAGLFPTKVGRFVLDGADDPWAETGGGIVAQTSGFEGDLKTYVTACLAEKKEAVGTSTCPLTGTVDQAMTSISGLLSSVATTPLKAKDGRMLGASTLATAIVDPLYSTAEWPDLTTLFASTLHGDPAEAFTLADDYNERSPKGTYETNTTEANTAINCLEGGADVSTGEMRKEAAQLTKAAPVLGPYEGYTDVTCDEWPVKPLAFPAPVTAPGAGPILVLGTTGDPATPYAEAKALAKQLSSGHLVTRYGQGHTAYDLGNTCIDTTVDAYLVHGTVPSHDPLCH